MSPGEHPSVALDWIVSSTASLTSGNVGKKSK